MTTVEPGYNDMDLYDTLTIQWVILWCQLIRHFFFVEDIP
jgi:hypothetical protein